MKCLLFNSLTLSLIWTLVGPTNARAQSAPQGLAASVESRADETPFTFKIPAPRGQILDCQGLPLARMVTLHRLMIEMPPVANETWDSYFLALKNRWPAIEKACPGVKMPAEEDLAEHFKERRKLPVPTPGVFDDKFAEAHPADTVEGVRWQAEYQRDYPNGTLAAHAIGYVTPVSPPLKGPLHHGEALWKEVVGKDGLEAAFEEQLAGKPGLLIVSSDRATGHITQHILIPPTPGQDVVTTLHREIQHTAETALAGAKRPGALVVVDPVTGNILALASFPTFAPGDFARGMSHDEFEKITKDRNGPMNHRAVAGVYPPGSVFKPFVALACLGTGNIQASTRLLCGPKLNIDGREFGNWSETDRGWFDLNAATVRSCNTYFYQAAIASGAAPVITTLRQFGFGQKSPFPLAAYAAGNLPSKAPNRQALANLSIGQGDVLASPLQVTMAMAALATGQGRMSPRFVTLVQSQQQVVTESTPPMVAARFNFSPDHLNQVREGMYGVVNHEQGTGTKARLAKQRVFGKTGTAEWSNRGKRANIVWFAGFVPDSHPPLAYALALESKPGEKVSGGLTAAPVVGQFLAEVFQNPDKHGIRPGAMPAPLLKEPLTPPEMPAPAPEALPAPVLAQEGATMPESPNLTALVAVPVPSGTPVGVSSNRALPVEETTPGASPALTLTSRTSPGEPPQAIVVPRAQPLAEEDNLPPAYDQTTQDPATPATRSRRSPLTSGNGVIMNSGGARSGPTVVRTQRKADALPPPIDPAPAPAPAAVAETLPPPVAAEAIPASAPAGEPNPRDRGNKAGRSSAKVPRATAVVEDPAASVVQAPSPTPAQPQPPLRSSKTATQAPKALPVESLPADAAIIPAEATPPPPPPEPRKRKFRLFGNDDDDDKKDEDD